MEACITLPQKRFDLIYLTGENDAGPFKTLVGYKLHEGERLFAVYATYARCLETKVPYYVTAKHKKEATERFKNRFPWLDQIRKIEEVSNPTPILSAPQRYIIL